MKALKKAGRLLGVPIPVLCYAVVLIVWLASCLFSLAADSIGRANGSITEQWLVSEDFRLEAMEKVGEETYLSTTYDPQLVLDAPNGSVRSLQYWAAFSGDGHEMCLYYTTRPGEEFSAAKRVWPEIQEDGSYLFRLPRKNISRLRLDPVSAQGLEMEFGGFLLNGPVSRTGYFNPGWPGLVMLLIGPALLAAAVRWLVDLVWHILAKRERKKA